MTLDITKLNATVAAVKAKAPANWSAKIERAASMLLSNPCITELAAGVLITSETCGWRSGFNVSEIGSPK